MGTAWRRIVWTAGGTLFLLAFPLQAAAGPEPAEVRIAFPLEGQTVRDTLKVQIEVLSSEEVAQVVLSRDGAFLEEDVTRPFEIRWDTRLESDGPHSILVRVRMGDGRWAASPPVRVLVDNTPPSVRLIEPAAGTLAAEKILLEAEAADNVGVAEVRFFIGNLMVGTAASPPYRLTWDPASTHNGRHAVKAAAFDRAGNESRSEVVEVKVANPNHPPILAPLRPQTVEEGDRISFKVIAHDPDGARDPLTFRASHLPPWARFDPATGEFSGTPDGSVASQDQAAVTYDLFFEVCDPEPLCTSETVTLTVINVNQPPTLPDLESVTVWEGEPLSLNLPQAEDPDGDLLEYSAKPLPPWLTFNPGSLTLDGTPGFEIASLRNPREEFLIQFEACDPEPSCVKKILLLSVRNTNRPPELERVGDQHIEEGYTLTIRVSASDPDKDPVTLEAKPVPRGGFFTDRKDGSGVFQWVTDLDQGGDLTLTLAASDGNLRDEQKIRIRVRETSLSLSGTILQKDQTPLEGVLVRIEGAGTIVQETKTDNRGFYLAHGLAPGVYIVRPFYATDRAFSTAPVVNPGTRFEPLSRKVTLEGADQRDIDFTALPLT